MKDRIESAKKLADEIVEQQGDNVASVLLFGTAIRGGITEAHQDLGILVIVRDASADALRSIEKPVNDWAKKGNFPPVIYTVEGWRDSTDVFPIEIEDMRDAHRLVHGEDPFDGLETTRQDLRMELERETRGKLLQLRAHHVAYAKDGKALTRLLVESITTFFVLMRALLRLEGEPPPSDPQALVNRACEIADLDPKAFRWVVNKIRGENVKALKRDDPIAVDYVAAIERLAAYVDRA